MKTRSFFILFFLTAVIPYIMFAQQTGNKVKKTDYSPLLKQRVLLPFLKSGEMETWKSLKLYDGEVTSIVRDPENCNIAYAGTRDAGVFKTTDGGLTWSPARNGLTFAPIRELSIDTEDPARIYAGTDYDGIWMTDDSCKTWHQTDYEGDMITFHIIIDPSDHNTVYATEAGGIGFNVGNLYKSVNKGENWIKKGNGMMMDVDHTNGIFSFAIDPSDSKILYAGTRSGYIHIR